MKFKDLKFEDVSEIYGENAIQALEGFENGIEASVVKHGFSYGNEQGLYEIGVFYNGRMVDVLGWDDTVKGYLHEDAVTDILEQLQKLED